MWKQTLRAAVEKDPGFPRVPGCCACGQGEVWLWQSSVPCSHQPSADKTTKGPGQGSALPSGAHKEWGLQENRAKAEPTEEKDRRLWLGCSEIFQEKLLP